MVDRHTASWILEFVLRQPIEDWLVKDIFFALPISTLEPHLKKTLLLRSIASELSKRSISERSLHSLEQIEEINRREGVEVSESMKAVYCAVAVECTARFLRKSSVDGGDFFDAVNRIWNCRMADLERSEAAGLVSARLKESRKEMEEAVVNPVFRVNFMERETKKEALDSVTVYLKEVTKEMGPSFLELAAESITKKGKGAGATKLDHPSAALNEKGKFFEAGRVGEGRSVLFQTNNGNVKNLEASKVGDSPAELNEKEKILEAGRGGEKSPSLSKAPVERHQDGAGIAGLDHASPQKIRARKSLSPGIGKHKRSRTTIVEDATHRVGNSDNEFDRLCTPEVRQVKEALKFSCADLQTVVKDPLPDAVTKAVGVSISREGESSTNLLEENQNRVDVNVPVSSMDKVAQVTHTEGISTGTGRIRGHDNVQLPNFIDQNPTGPQGSEENQNRVDVNAPVSSVDNGAKVTSIGDIDSVTGQKRDHDAVLRPSLMDRNPTARTYEWDDESIESPSESPNQSKKLHLPSPKKRAVSPLNLKESTKCVRRRKIKRWSLVEEDTLRKAVKMYEKHGKGNWKFILSVYPEIFEDRTEVDLKDKWRNMSRQ